MDEPTKIIIPCINPVQCCCEHRLVGRDGKKCEFFCKKWRENRFKDQVFRACEPEYAVKESAIIDAEAEQKNRFRLRSEK